MADTVKIIDSQQAFDDLTKLSGQLSGIEKQINSMATSSAKMNSSLSGMTSILELNDRLKKVETSQGKVNSKMTEAEKIIRATDRAQEKLKLTLEGHTKALIQARAKTTALNAEIRKGVQGAATASSGFSRLATTIKSLVAAFGLISGAQLFVTVIKDVFKLTTTLNSMDFAIKAVIKSDIELAQTKIWLSKITNDFGAELVTTTNRYIKFRAASQQAGFSASETQRIFGTMTKAAGVLGLKTDELTGIYLALEQMISKGKITTEELRRQLGERLPGAMDIMAKSMGVTTSELDKMMKAGLVITKDVLPGFAEQVEKSFGIENIKKVETLQAATMRLKNSWTELIMNLEGSKGSVSGVFAIFIDNATELLTIYTKLNNIINELGNSSESIKRISDAWGKVKSDEIGLLTTIKNSIDAMDSYIKKYDEKNIVMDRALELTQEVNEGHLTHNEMLKIGSELYKLTTEELTAYIEALEKQMKLISENKDGDILEGTVEWYKKLISENNKIIEQTKTKNDLKEVRRIQAENKGYQAQIDLILGVIKAGKKAEKPIVEGLIGNKADMFGSIQYLKDIISENEALILISKDESLVRKYQKENDALKLMIDRMKGVSELSYELADTRSASFNLVPDMSGLDIALKQIENFTEKHRDQIEQAIDTTNMFFDNRIEKLSQDRDSNEDYYDNLISLAEGNEDEQKRLEYAKKVKDDELKQKQNEAAKKQAIFNRTLAVAEIAYNTGIAFQKAVAASPLTGGLPWTAIVTALGAAQAAAIISQPLPKFKDGKDAKNFYEGLAIVNDGGTTEYREDKLGNISAFKGVNTLTHVAKDDIIHKDLDSLISSKGYDANDIYKATIMASLASDRDISTMRLEKVLDNSLKDLKKDIKDGLQSGFRNVNFNSYPKVDLGHINYRKNTL